MNNYLNSTLAILADQQTTIQIGLVLMAFMAAQIVSTFLRRKITILREEPSPGEDEFGTVKVALFRLGSLLTPLLTVISIRIAAQLIADTTEDRWLLVAVSTLTLVYCYFKAVAYLVSNPVASKALLLIGIPFLALQSLGVAPILTSALDSIGFQIGNIHISLLGVLRVTVFGTFIFWLGRAFNNTGQRVIRRQEKLDNRTREVIAKLFEIGIFVLVALLLLQIMGINLTALAVFGGALGVGLGFGLQSIASNFISGMIILLDRSLSVGDFVELEDGRSGYVTALNMRSTTVETFEGKDIMVPNEVFTTTSFANWTRKNQKQRYRVDFSVAYDTDIRKPVEVIKEAVASHSQVLSGENYPVEERPGNFFLAITLRPSP